MVFVSGSQTRTAPHGRGGAAYVFGETAVKTQHSVGLEVLAQKLLASSAVEAGNGCGVSYKPPVDEQGVVYTHQWPHSSELSAVTRSPISKPFTSSAKPREVVVSELGSGYI